MVFSFDSSIFIHMKRDYPRDKKQNLRLWEIIEERMETRYILITKEVVEELKRGTDDLASWIKNYPECILESTDDIQDIVGRISNRFPGWVNALTEENQADPYVIAIAQLHDGKVITQEKIHFHLDQNPEQIANQPHALNIPNVCKLLNIEYNHLMGFITEIGKF